jgi:hypothetical protein
MIRRISSALAIATVLACLVPTPASAQEGFWSWLSAWRERREERREVRRETRREKSRSIPEFDPAAVGAISALLVGGGVLIARRRRR